MRRSTDLRRSDVALGVLVAGLVVGTTAAGVAEGASQPAPILAEGEVAVRVRPVPDAPPKIPTPTPTVTGPTGPTTRIDPNAPPRDPNAIPGPSSIPGAAVGPSNGAPAIGSVPPRPADAPPPTNVLPPRPRGGIKALPRVSGPEAPALPGVATEPGFGPGGPGVAPGTADPEDSPDDPYAYVDPSLEDPGAEPGGPGLVGGTEPTAEPGLSPAEEHAIAIFRQRLQRWISIHFIVSGAGLTAKERDGATVRAVIVLDDTRHLVNYTVDDGGHPALRAAAEDALQVLLGTRAPEPPIHYPGPVQQRIRVTFRCTEATCD